jgi:hypothetical protein
VVEAARGKKVSSSSSSLSFPFSSIVDEPSAELCKKVYSEKIPNCPFNIHHLFHSYFGPLLQMVLTVNPSKFYYEIKYEDDYKTKVLEILLLIP